MFLWLDKKFHNTKLKTFEKKQGKNWRGVGGLTPPGAVVDPSGKVPKWGWGGRFWTIYS